MATASLLQMNTHVPGASPFRLPAASRGGAASNAAGLAGHSSKLRCAGQSSPKSLGLARPSSKIDAASFFSSTGVEDILRRGKNNDSFALPGVAVLSCEGTGSRQWRAESDAFKEPVLKLFQATVPTAAVGQKGRLGRANASNVERPVENHEGQEKILEAAAADGFADSKLCTECGVRKPLRNFEKMVTSADGRHLVCRACLATRRAQERGSELHHLAMPVAEAWAQARACCRCKHVQELRDFSRHARSKDSLRPYCRSCHSEAFRPPLNMVSNSATGVATCSRCGQEKSADEFYFRDRSKSRLRSYCKTCAKETSREQQARASAAGAFVRRPDKVCRGCQMNKPRESFNKQSWSRDGLQNYCRDCNALMHRQWRSRRRSSNGA